MDTTLEQTMILCLRSLKVYNATFKEETFYSPYTSIHDEMYDVIEHGGRKEAIAAPRGLGKTTTCRSYVERAILFRQYQFIVWISNSETNALLQTENIKRELLTNKLIRELFGDIRVNAEDPDMNEEFSKKGWVANGHTFILPRGKGQQIRGLLWKRFRPQLIIIDDLEKKEELENPENRRKDKEWFFSDVEKCVNRYDNNWRMLYIDTVKHFDSLLENLLDVKDWHGTRIDLCDDEYNSKAPQLISTEELKKEAETHRARGMLDVFFMEYRNMPVAKENQGFDAQYFQYYEERELQGREIENVIIVDPAKTANMKSADSAIVCWGIDYASNALYFRDCVNGKFHPDEIYEIMFLMALRNRAHVIGVEVTGLDEFIKQPLINESQRRGPEYAFEFVWLKARGGPAEGEKGKIKRIGSLIPYYRQGLVYHNRTCCAALESQLITFPRSKLVDVSDAAAYIVELLELGERYFSPPDNSDVLSAEYAELEYEDSLDWGRVI